MEIPPVFIYSIVLCRNVEHTETGVNFIEVLHSLVLDDGAPNFENTADFQICLNAVVQDATAVHKMVVGVISPDGTKEWLGVSTMAEPRYGLSTNQIPFRFVFRQEGLHWLVFGLLKGEILAHFALPVGSDTILTDKSDREG